MKLTTNLELAIEKLSHEGRGIAYLENKVVFVENALPGEKVIARLVSRRSKFNLAQAVAITHPAPERVTPICPHYHICGGCALQHLVSTQQLALKTTTLKEQLKIFGKITHAPLLTPLTGPTVGYRRRARLSLKWVKLKDRLLIGFHEKYKPLVADLQVCPILDPRVGLSLQKLATLVNQLSIPTQIPQIELACGDEEVALIFRHLAPLTEIDITHIRAFGDQFNYQCYTQPGALDSLIALQSSSPLTYRYRDLTFHFNPTSFIQTNAVINHQLIDQALDWLALKAEDRVCDLFCGLGNFTLPIATRAQSVLGLEGEAEAVNLGRKNAAYNQLSNVDFATADLNQAWLDRVISLQPNKLILDPPRTGALEVCQTLTPRQFERVVYVSCNSATFARDAGVLIQNGYQLHQIRLADMYPHTKHVEIIALFQ